MCKSLCFVLSPLSGHSVRSNDLPAAMMYRLMLASFWSKCPFLSEPSKKCYLEGWFLMTNFLLPCLAVKMGPNKQTGTLP